MQDIIVLETRLAEITVPSEDDLGDKRNYAVMSLDDLQRKAPFVRLPFPSYTDYLVLQLSRTRSAIVTTFLQRADILSRATRS